MCSGCLTILLSCLVEAGYDVMSVANNHVNDFGGEGRASTAAMLDSVGIAYAGFDYPSLDPV